MSEGGSVVPGGWTPGPPGPTPAVERSPLVRAALIVLAVCVAGAAAVGVIGVDRPPEARSTPRPSDRVDPIAGDAVRIVADAPSTWDPARAGDVGTAAILTQVYEGLTAFDAAGAVQPALAERWTVERDGARLVFELRPGIRFSDGTPITAGDVVRSWLRLLDPERPSPLASLLDDVAGAAAYRAGTGSREAVGLTADEGRVVVDFRRPATYFVAVTASPSLAIVPDAGVSSDEAPPADPVVSGAYLPEAAADGTISLRANAAYWAGVPAIGRIDVITDLGGRSAVELFEEDAVDYTPISAFDASWIRYDTQLGPQLRRHEGLSVDMYGFDTTEPPFDDPAVRRAFAQAVDWDRVVALGSDDWTAATSLMPVGIPARGETDLSPVYDPDGARALLADAGYEDGVDFPAVTLTTYGLPFDDAVAHELTRELGVVVEVETRPADEHFALLDADPPAFWTLSWSADYPAAHDFLGLLLETGSSSNETRWSHAPFDAILGEAAATTDLAEQERLYGEASRMVRDEAPLIPVSYRPSYALSRDGLLGAIESGVGYLRFAGLAWDE